MDEMVYQTQRWLNQTYGSDSRYNTISEDGITGWGTIYALTRALQIELGIQNTADNFGPTSKTLYGQNPLQRQDGVENNKFAILQGAMWCKGYSTGHYYSQGTLNGYSRVFDESVEDAVMQLQGDAGLLNPNGIVSTNLMAALLSMDAFKLLSSYGGKAEIRAFQQEMNQKYEPYIGLMSCDGIYSRNTNKAAIYAIQAEEGIPVGVANGNFGPTTKSCCPTIPYLGLENSYTNTTYTQAKIDQFTKIFKFGLYANDIDFGNGSFSGSLDTFAVELFQRRHALPVTGIADIATWMSIFTSSGDVNRSAQACDCATILTSEKAQTLLSNGYEIVGRYLTGTASGGISKALSLGEISIIFAAGLRFFPIYQTSGNSAAYFTSVQGTTDANAAISATVSFRLPYHTVIYFAVDFDATDAQITSKVLPYFSSIKSAFTQYGKYRIGVYGSRNVCHHVVNAGYATHCFVGDMSTGFSGNLGFSIPTSWSFDQFTTVTIGSGSGSIQIDKDGYSGRDHGVQYQYSIPLNAGVGSGIVNVNRAGQNLNIFAGREEGPGGGYWRPVGSIIDVVPPGGFYVYKGFGTDPDMDEGGWNQRCHRIIYTNSEGVQAEGFVYIGNSGNDNEELDDEMYEAIWDYQEPFHYYVCDASNNSLVPATRTNIGGTYYTEYTLTAPTGVYTSPEGNFVKMLSEGTKVAIAGSIAGDSNPFLIYVDKEFVYDSTYFGDWTDLGAFIDLRFDLGNMPNNRLLR
jgi:peptidoglycan hydrolase-like protein with peptidoglycan-binding domain